MGYTHYFTIIKQPTFEQWAPIRKAMQEVFALRIGSLVRFESDSPEPPLANDTLIRFNGIREAGHETFFLSREDEGFQFCKTACKPYDSLVTACLTLVGHFAPDCYDIGSDGDPEDWEEGLKLAESVADTTMKIPIS